MTQCIPNERSHPPSPLPSSMPSKPISSASCALSTVIPMQRRCPKLGPPSHSRGAGHPAHTEPVDRAFVDELMDSPKSLRAYAVSLTGDIHRAEDPVHETVLKAISRQERLKARTSLQSWLFTILRNYFFSGRRTKQRDVEDTDRTHVTMTTTITDQEDRLMVQDLHTVLTKPPREQRKALLPIGGEGLSYEEAVESVGTKVGTITSQVDRARTHLAELMGLVRDDSIAWSHGAPA